MIPTLHDDTSGQAQTPPAQPELIDRRAHIQLTEDQAEVIAERAAQRAVELITSHAYQSIGKGIVEKAFWIVGVLAMAAYIWALKSGFITLPK